MAVINGAATATTRKTAISTAPTTADESDLSRSHACDAERRAGTLDASAATSTDTCAPLRPARSTVEIPGDGNRLPTAGYSQTPTTSQKRDVPGSEGQRAGVRALPVNAVGRGHGSTVISSRSRRAGS